MRTRTVLTLLIVVAFTACAHAQGDDTKKPWTGVVTGDDVYVRSSPKVTPGTRCTQLDKGSKVTVVRTIGGGLSRKWYEIQPVKNTFSVIAKQYVDLTANDRGTVTGNNVNVRGGGDLSRRGQYNYVHRIRLNKGDKVEIKGKSGQYYAIESPKGATFFIAAEHVVPNDEYTGPAVRKDEKPKDTSTRKDTPETDPNVVKTDKPREEVAAVVKAWKEAEKALQEEYEKPYAKRDLQAVLAGYKAIELSEDSYLKPYVQARIAFLQTQMKQADEIEKIEQMVKKSLAEQERLRMLRSKLKTTTPTDKPVTEYTVTGVLKASRLFSGGATGKKRYMVLGKDGTRIKAYAQSVADVVDLSKYEGKYVGIYGPKKFDKKLSGLYIVNAEAVTVLEEQVDLPEAPSAKVKAPPVKPKKKQPSDSKDTKAAESGKPQRPDFSEQEEEMEEAKEAAEEADVVEPADIEVEEVSIDDLPDTGLPVVESSAVSPVAEAEYE